MKKNGILNREISAVISEMGHTDDIMIADCGLPIPPGVLCIDLSLKVNDPSVLEVLKVLSAELTVEKIYVASEMKEEYKIKVGAIVGDVNTQVLLHSDLKRLSANCKAIIRTGDITSFSNIILSSGVDFEELYEYSNEKY